MLEKRYRIQAKSGLSAAYTLHELRQEAASSTTLAAAQCTADEGETWVSVASLMAAPHDSATPQVADPSDSTKSETNTANSASTAHSFKADPPNQKNRNRKLKRLGKTDGESKFTKRSAERKLQKASGKIVKPQDLIGAHLANGRYIVKSMLGKGSMAYVFLVSDQRLETDAVVKIPKPEKFTTVDFSDRFKRECQLLVRFSHPHVVKVLDVGEHGQLPYVVMQLLSGGSLTDRMANEADDQGRMSPESLKSWVREVGRALDFCFRKGMVHRDVKPANILFDEDHNPYVADFGLSKVMYGEHEDLNSSETAAGIVLGTPNYISPEVVLGQPYDGRADQYSLGITVYHALTGKAPMQGNSATATMVNQTQKSLDLLSDVRPDMISRPLAHAIQKSIEKNPNKRFASCEEFGDAILNGLRVPVSRTTIAASSASGGTARPTAISPVAEQKTAAPQRSRSQPGKKSAASSASASSPARSKAGSSEALAPNMDWFDASDESSSASSRKKSSAPRRRAATVAGAPAALPPKKSAGKQNRGDAKKASTTNGVVLFGQKLSPMAAAGIGIGLVAVFLLIVIVRMTGEDEPAANSGLNSGAIEPSAAAVDSDNANSNQNVSGSKKKQKAPQPSGDSKQNTAPATQIAAAEVAAAKTAPVNKKQVQKAVEKPSNDLVSSEKKTESATTRFVSIPFESAENFTVSIANCPVLLSGNRVWDKGTKSVLRRLDGSFAGQAQTALSADGRFFAAASKPPDEQNTAITVWDTKTGKQLFTAPGDSKRFADVILLSSSLYVGDRWSEELLVWDCETGKQGKPVQLNEAKFKRGNAALSNDGLYIAAMAQGRMVILNTADGNLGGLMQNPGKSVRMKRASLLDGNTRAKSRNQDAGLEAEPVFAALQSLAFSVDNKELAGFSTFPRPRLMLWNSQGELTVDQPAASVSGTESPALQWFVDRSALLVSGSILDRETGRVVLTTVSDKAKRTSVSVYDDDHLVCVLRNSPTQLSIVPIPWQTISDALQNIEDVDSALLAVGSSVSLQVLVTDLLPGGSSELEDVRQTFTEALTLEGLKIEQGRSTIFRISVTAEADKKTSILDRLMPLQQRADAAAADRVPKSDCVVLELFTSIETSAPIWRVNLGALADLGLVDAPKRVIADKLMALITEVNFPYFIPRDEQAVGLPIVID